MTRDDTKREPNGNGKGRTKRASPASPASPPAASHEAGSSHEMVAAPRHDASRESAGAASRSAGARPAHQQHDDRPQQDGRGRSEPDHRQPAHDTIAARAYALYEQRGRQGGHEVDDWLQAERELLQGG